MKERIILHSDLNNFYASVECLYHPEYTDQVEPYGLDEYWLDVSGSTSLFGSGEDIANEIRKRVKFELGVSVSLTKNGVQSKTVLRQPVKKATSDTNRK